jgi:hypothetical protein
MAKAREHVMERVKGIEPQCAAAQTKNTRVFKSKNGAGEGDRTQCAAAQTKNTRVFKSKNGAGEGDRTLVLSLENSCSTIELHPQLHSAH